MEEIDKEQLISLQEAAKLCPHSQEYLSLLARQGKLRAVKVDRTWFTTKQWLKNYISREFISLQVAATISPYSQEYLSLRARQGKLRAVKIGRNWFTTKDWLRTYTEQATQYKEQATRQKYTKAKVQVQQKVPRVRTLSLPPENLPVEGLFEVSIPTAIANLATKKLGFAELFRVTGAFAVVLALLSVTSVLSRDTFQEVSRDVYPVVQSSINSATAYMPTFNLELRQTPYLQSSVADIGKNYTNWFKENLFGLGRTIVRAVQSTHHAIAQGIRNLGKNTGERITENSIPPVAQQPAPSPAPPSAPPKTDEQKKGLVVVPSSDNNEQVKQQVKKSFSDQVIVAPQDDESGIITPVFRERDGSDYFYILVPLQE